MVAPVAAVAERIGNVMIPPAATSNPEPPSEASRFLTVNEVRHIESLDADEIAAIFQVPVAYLGGSLVMRGGLYSRVDFG